MYGVNVPAEDLTVEICPRERGGNGTGSISFFISLLLKFNPVRGRKLLRENLQDLFRKLKFNPVRGRKLITVFRLEDEIVEIYPREGTETGTYTVILLPPAR